MPCHLVLQLTPCQVLPMPLSPPPPASKASATAAHPMKRKRNISLGYNIPFLCFIWEGATTWEGLPTLPKFRQAIDHLVLLPYNLKSFLERPGKFLGERKTKRDDRQCFVIKKNWNTSAKRDEYHPLLLFIGIFSAACFAGHGPIFPLIQA